MEGGTGARGGLFLVFHLDNRLYGVPVSAVREILPMVEITPLPNAPPFFRGIVNLRGAIVPIIDLRRKLKLPERKPDGRTCLVVCDSPDRPFGFLADRVTDCLEIFEISRPEESGAVLPAEPRFMDGIGQHDGKIIVLLDLESVISAADRRIFKLL